MCPLDLKTLAMDGLSSVPAGRCRIINFSDAARTCHVGQIWPDSLMAPSRLELLLCSCHANPRKSIKTAPPERIALKSDGGMVQYFNRWHANNNRTGSPATLYQSDAGTPFAWESFCR